MGADLPGLPRRSVSVQKAYPAKHSPAMVKARTCIVQRANQWIIAIAGTRRPWIPAKLLEPRHIQRAVHIARRYKLVPEGTLVEAGFRP